MASFEWKQQLEVMIQTVTGNHKTNLFLIRECAHSYSWSNSFFYFKKRQQIALSSWVFFPFSLPYYSCTEEFSMLSWTYTTVRWIISFIKLSVLPILMSWNPKPACLLWSLTSLPQSHSFCLFVNGPMSPDGKQYSSPLTCFNHSAHNTDKKQAS